MLISRANVQVRGNGFVCDFISVSLMYQTLTTSNCNVFIPKYSEETRKGLSWASHFQNNDFCVVDDLFDLKICFDIFDFLYRKEKYSKLSIKR